MESGGQQRAKSLSPPVPKAILKKDKGDGGSKRASKKVSLNESEDEAAGSVSWRERALKYEKEVIPVCVRGGGSKARATSCRSMR